MAALAACLPFHMTDVQAAAAPAPDAAPSSTEPVEAGTANAGELTNAGSASLPSVSESAVQLVSMESTATVDQTAAQTSITAIEATGSASDVGNVQSAAPAGDAANSVTAGVVAPQPSSGSAHVVDAAAAQAQFASATLPTALADQAAAPDVSGSVVTPLDGSAPATEDEKSHPVHNVLVRMEVLAENLPNEFMNALKRLVVEGRDELRRIL
jgi:hypothetical protein